MAEAILATESVTKSFSGLTVVKAVTLDFSAGQIHAIIGPNGAGKTTLINLLSGELQPTEGRVRYKGRDMTGFAPDQFSRLGIGRSFQITNLYPSLSCMQNCWIAAQSRLPTSMRFFRSAERLSDVHDRARAALELCGLWPQHDTVAAFLSHGERRKLEIALVLATEPELFLLDEPLAGIGAHEHQDMIDLLRQIAKDHTLVLIEHDMDAIFQIADTLIVMVNGELLARGSVDEIRANRAVQEAYLGHGDGAG
jgi:branched-chain amino acid transport system ATP-binding protein